MKKLIFLLLMAVAIVGFMSALGAVHPPGAFAPEAVLAEYSVQQDVVAQPTVLVTAVETAAQPRIIQAVITQTGVISIKDEKTSAAGANYLLC